MKSNKAARRVGQKIGRLVSRTLFFVVIAVIWEASVLALKIPDYLLPTPSAVVISLVKNFNLLLRHSYVTVYETILGFLLGAAIGITFAILLVYSSYLRSTLLPSLVAFNAFPKVAFAPLLVVWFGLGIFSKVVMAFLISFFPIVINTASGLAQIEPDLVNLLRLMKATQWQTFVKLRLPHSLPAMFDAFKVSIPLAVIGAIVGEYAGAGEGAGYLILLATSRLDTPVVFGILLMIGMISVSLFAIIVLFERFLLRWRPSQRSA